MHSQETKCIGVIQIINILYMTTVKSINSKVVESSSTVPYYFFFDVVYQWVLS